MTAPLHFQENRPFTIVQFTDTHWINGEPEDLQTRVLMAEILDAEKPDLAVLTGDLIFGDAAADPAASWLNAVEPIVERKLPWAATFGNHDDEGALSREGLMALQQTVPGCLSEPGPENVNGVGNFALRLYASSGERVAWLLYFLDVPTPPPDSGWGWIRKDQIAWYKETAQAMRKSNAGIQPPALAFFHVPLPEYEEVWNHHPCRGHNYEGVGCPTVNSGCFEAFCATGDVRGVFVGHDHVNDYEGELRGIRLCYGRGSGFSCYGREGFKRGARVIRLWEGSAVFDTWLRLEGNERVSEQPLHDPLSEPVPDNHEDVPLS